MPAIAFVGDSYCASYGQALHTKRGCPLYQVGTNDPTYPDLVAKALNYNLYPCGYGGKGWWFSRQRLLDEITATGQTPEIIVFCHSDSQRINNAWDIQLHNTPGPQSRDYYKYIHDDEFNRWAQKQWFKEIASCWAEIKTIHFHCFTQTPDWSDLLPGMVYTTPLVHISVGELTGTEAEILSQMGENEKRKNHLSARNNQVLGEVILDAINDYRPGKHELDLGRFELINHNSVKFPHTGYGTKK